MNQSKLKYARERLREIVHIKRQAVPDWDHEDELEYDDAIKRLRAGTHRVNWKKITDVTSYNRGLMTQILEQVCGKENKAVAKRNRKRQAARVKIVEKISDAARLVEDELVLGDELKAMALLDAFAKA